MLLTSKNIAANIVALDIKALQNTSIGATSHFGGSIVAAVHLLFLFPAALTVVLEAGTVAMAVPLRMIVLASEGDCGDGNGEEDDGEGLDGNHLDRFVGGLLKVGELKK